ncbi:uncharacterized protein LOC123684320 [Harmonia axyridis]|uniref:uncharacterized protein LOC123684320 n=1 Tax=Harmonia axyridis TaxID=115357 RepID=UPI001E277144|nr:uncharacterized protein LOC123684320 [Harmonia axyridis]
MKEIFIFVFIILIESSSSLFDNELNLKCTGRKFENVSLTAYYPDYDDEDNQKGYQDSKGHKLRTLQDYIDDRTNYVTLAMDETLNIPYGTKACIPELNQHFGHRVIFEVRDTSSDSKGSRYKRAEICVRTEIDSYDISVNRMATLYLM